MLSLLAEAAAEDRRLLVLAAADLAAATDPALDPDRHAWHRAQSVSGPDEEVAMELERAAGRARARGGLSATAAFLERATMLTPDPARQARRALDAAEANMLAGAFDAALDLLAMAEAGPAGELRQAHPDLVRAQIPFAKSRGTDAAPLLLDVASRLERVEPGRSRETYLDTMKAAMFAGRLAGPGGGLRDVARVVGAATWPPDSLRAPDLLLVGLAANFNQGYAAAVPFLRRGLAGWPSWSRDVPEEERPAVSRPAASRAAASTPAGVACDRARQHPPALPAQVVGIRPAGGDLRSGRPRRVPAARDRRSGLGRPARLADRLRAAARRLRAQPARCVVFEDSPAGVTAASRAGMYPIEVCTAHTPPGLAHGAHFTVSSLAEVSRALRGRTLARSAHRGPSG